VEMLARLRSAAAVPVVLGAACVAAALWFAPDVFDVLFTVWLRPGSDPAEWFGQMLWGVSMAVGLFFVQVAGVSAALLGWGTAAPRERSSAAAIVLLWLLSILVWLLLPETRVLSVSFVLAQVITLGLTLGMAAAFGRRAHARWRTMRRAGDATVVRRGA